MTAFNPAVRTVTACFPCYNDARTIATMVLDVRSALAPIVDELEIVVVDDGSSDDSAEVLKLLTDEVPESSSSCTTATEGTAARSSAPSRRRRRNGSSIRMATPSTTPGKRPTWWRR